MELRKSEGAAHGWIVVAAVVSVVVVSGIAISVYQRFPAAVHDNRSLMRLRDAMTLADLGRRESAEAAFADAISFARSAPDVHDEQAALLMRAEARINVGDDVDAEADLSAATSMDGTIAVSGGGVVQPDDSRFLAFVDRAIVRVRHSRLAEARNDLTAALSAIPDYAGQRLFYLERQRANGLAWARDCRATISQRSRALEIDSDSPSAMLAYAERGACRKWLGDEAGAAADFARSNELRQNPGLIRFFRGVLNQIEGDCAAARIDYGEASRLNPHPAAKPPHRRSSIGTLYGYHAAWFAEAASRVSDRVTPRFEALSANLARCGS